MLSRTLLSTWYAYKCRLSSVSPRLNSLKKNKSFVFCCLTDSDWIYGLPLRVVWVLDLITITICSVFAHIAFAFPYMQHLFWYYDSTSLHSISKPVAIASNFNKSVVSLFSFMRQVSQASLWLYLYSVHRCKVYKQKKEIKRIVNVSVFHVWSSIQFCYLFLV